MDLERFFNSRLETLAKHDDISIRFVRFHRPSKSRVFPTGNFSLLRPEFIEQIGSFYNDHDGIELEWDGTIGDRKCHGSINICCFDEAIERISKIDPSVHYNVSDDSESVAEKWAWTEIERVYGRSDTVILGGANCNEVYWLNGENLAKWYTDWTQTLTTLVSVLGFDEIRPILCNENWVGSGQKLVKILYSSGG